MSRSRGKEGPKSRNENVGERAKGTPGQRRKEKTRGE